MIVTTFDCSRCLYTIVCQADIDAYVVIIMAIKQSFISNTHQATIHPSPCASRTLRSPSCPSSGSSQRTCAGTRAGRGARRRQCSKLRAASCELLLPDGILRVECINLRVECINLRVECVNLRDERINLRGERINLRGERINLRGEVLDRGGHLVLLVGKLRDLRG